jgi:hypothetical protein
MVVISGLLFTRGSTFTLMGATLDDKDNEG